MTQEANSTSFPPPGMVNGEEARRMFGVSQWTWDQWVKQGKIHCGEPLGPSGRYKLFPIEELRRVIEALREPQPFLLLGMVDGEQARRMFGVSRWMWDKWMKQGKIRCGRWVSIREGGRAKVYPIEEFRRAIEELRTPQPFPPPGFVGREEACRMFGVALPTWTSWTVHGKVPPGQWFMIPGGGRCRLYPVEQLRRLLEEMRGAGKAYWDPQNPGYYRVPEGWVRKQDAMRMFGVNKPMWQRWEREGLIRCGERVNRAAPKLYRIDDLKRLVEEYGRYAPPYPDPQRPHVYRVPLSGHDIRRREAIIDAEDLPVVEGRRWAWCPASERDGGLTGHVAHSKQGETTPLHRIIMGVTDPDLHVMPRNDDPLDCRRENLVVRTLSEQGAAARKMKTWHGRPCTSRFKGVTWDRRRGKWVAQIRRDGKRNLGRFDDEIAAAEAYDEAARETWGEHARLNFPDGIDAALEREARAA